MGAGKSTAVQALAAAPFWKSHGSNVVIIEADAFKMQVRERSGHASKVLFTAGCLVLAQGPGNMV